MKMQDKGKICVWYATTYLRGGKKSVSIHKHTHMATVIIFSGRITTTFLMVILREGKNKMEGTELEVRLL